MNASCQFFSVEGSRDTLSIFYTVYDMASQPLNGLNWMNPKDCHNVVTLNLQCHHLHHLWVKYQSNLFTHSLSIPPRSVKTISASLSSSPPTLSVSLLLSNDLFAWNLTAYESQFLFSFKSIETLSPSVFLPISTSSRSVFIRLCASPPPAASRLPSPIFYLHLGLCSERLPLCKHVCAHKPLLIQEQMLFTSKWCLRIELLVWLWWNLAQANKTATTVTC